MQIKKLKVTQEYDENNDHCSLCGGGMTGWVCFGCFCKRTIKVLDCGPTCKIHNCAPCPCGVNRPI